MRLFLSVFLFFFVIEGVGCAEVKSLGNPSGGLVCDARGGPTPELIRIFSILKPWIEKKNNARPVDQRISCQVIERACDINMSPTLADLNVVAQAFFLRPPQSERAALREMKDTFLKTELAALCRAFAAIGDVFTRLPSQKTYHYILINGATVPVMRARIHDFISCVRNGQIVLNEKTEVIFLVGDRDLFAGEERLDPTLQTEADSAKWLWEHTNLPQSLKGLNPVFVVAPKKWDKKLEKWVRPNTADTLKGWIEKENPDAGSCLSISSQPFVFYQEATLRKGLSRLGKSDLTVEGVGKSFEVKTEGDIAVLLDNLARTLYTLTS